MNFLASRVRFRLEPCGSEDVSDSPSRHPCAEVQQAVDQQSPLGLDCDSGFALAGPVSDKGASRGYLQSRISYLSETNNEVIENA